MDLILHLLQCLTISNVVSGLTVFGPIDVTVERGDMVQLPCSAADTLGPPIFTWTDVTLGVEIFRDGQRIDPGAYPSFDVDEMIDTTTGTSTLVILNTEIEQEGTYRCEVFGAPEQLDAFVTVEVRSTLTVTISSPLREGEEATAQCDAVGGRPEETLTWFIDNQLQTTGAVISNPTNPVQANVTNTRSVLTFTPTAADDGQILSCRITGHAVSALNQRMDTTLDIQPRAAPTNGSITVTIENQGTSLLVTCNITADPPPYPSINSYVIDQDDDVISNNNTVNVSPVPESCTIFTCTASNELGNTTAVAPEYCPVELGSPPTSGSIAVTVEDRGTSLLVSCNVTADPPNPSINNYVIFQNGNAISNNNTAILSPVPESCTNFTCTASNELGNTSAVASEYCRAVVTLELDTVIEILAAGDTYNATCRAIGGRPPQNITWFLESTPITTGIVSSVSDNENPRLSDTVSQLTFTPTAADHRSTLSCRSSSGASQGILLRVLNFCSQKNNVPQEIDRP